MEPMGAFLESEWDFLNKMFANEDDVDFTPQFAAGQISPILFGQGEELHLDIHPTFCPAYQADMSMMMTRENENLFYSIDAFIPNGVGGGNVFFVNPSPPFNTKLSDNVSVSNSNCMAVDISVDEIHVNSFNSKSLTDILMEGTLSLGDNSNGDTMIVTQNQPGAPSANPGNQIKLKRKAEIEDMPVHAEGKSNSPVENQKKKPRVSSDVRRSKRNAQPKKPHNQTSDASVEEETDVARTSDLMSSSSCSAEEDNTLSHETNGVVTSSSSNALNSNGKARASRGSATDPQSLYARRRRERINERLRILQNLVPNGTKVDISTMLEEAVHYVKFLQLQIKLLSSDELWMYAPIAYNGMDIALNLSKRLSSSL